MGSQTWQFLKCTAQKTQFLYGLPNEVINFFLVAVPALEGESLFYSIIISTSNSNEHTRIQMEDLSFATSQQITNA